ncbi:MAG: SCO family protein, partial [Haliea sp.]
MSNSKTAIQTRGIRLTVIGVLVFILVIVAGFVNRIGQPRVMSAAEMQANGAFLLQTPRDIGEFE